MGEATITGAEQGINYHSWVESRVWREVVRLSQPRQGVYRSRQTGSREGVVVHIGFSAISVVGSAISVVGSTAVGVLIRWLGYLSRWLDSSRRSHSSMAACSA